MVAEDGSYVASEVLTLHTCKKCGRKCEFLAVPHAFTCGYNYSIFIFNIFSLSVKSKML